MTELRLIDTNLIIRYVVRDHDAHARAADRIFDDLATGRIRLGVLPEVLAESVFVLESFYQRARADIARVLSVLITSAGIEIIDGAVYLDALERYKTSALHFVDCVIAAQAVARDVAVATFDAGFRKFRDVRVRTEPTSD
jgi:predicted nucleic acid-binding protein